MYYKSFKGGLGCIRKILTAASDAAVVATAAPATIEIKIVVTLIVTTIVIAIVLFFFARTKIKRRRI